ncbi:uncharacterized protein LOC132601360 [Lycium barbarum]|uniref:uncharacterized protein LOC132601360 n=1 Tax=Lycium barbarum TaxID=112863 RepID=UPI00293E7DAC|nr:uncharacterized protein LOC132601360 [Lycium barbarum]
MAPENQPTIGPPIFIGENYHIWAIKMKAYLKALNLWEVVERGEPVVQPLRVNATLNEIKKYDELVTRSPRALTCIHSILTEVMFTRIMACETAKEAWDKLKEEFEGNNRVKSVRVFTLKREFELLKMKDSDSVKEYSSKLMEIVNQIRILGEDFLDQKVIEKILVSLPDKFESKISAIEESRDLTTFTIAELISKLQVQEQKVTMRSEGIVEDAFQVRHKFRQRKEARKASLDNSREVNSGENQGDSSRKGKFPPCGISKKTNHLEKNCWQKPKRPPVQCRYCKRYGHIERNCSQKQNQSGQSSQRANFADDH